MLPGPGNRRTCRKLPGSRVPTASAREGPSSLRIWHRIAHEGRPSLTDHLQSSTRRGGEPPRAHALDVVATPPRSEELPGIGAVDRDFAIVEDEFDGLVVARQSRGASDPRSIHFRLLIRDAVERREGRRHRQRTGMVRARDAGFGATANIAA